MEGRDNLAPAFRCVLISTSQAYTKITQCYVLPYTRRIPDAFGIYLSKGIESEGTKTVLGGTEHVALQSMICRNALFLRVTSTHSYIDFTLHSSMECLRQPRVCPP